MKKSLSLLLVLLLLLPTALMPGYAESADEAAPAESEAKVLQDNLVVTEHETVIHGQKIPYTATTGTMALSSSLGQYEIFFAAYTRSDVDDLTQRPITFAFNGGPGCATLWLHMGFFGPRRVELDPVGNATQIPVKLLDNEYSILDMTDVVFIDPVGTGYSRTLEGTSEDAFYTYQGDIQSVGDFVRLYLNRYHRWSSPKYVAGESYGTVRAVGLCEYLYNTYFIPLNGLMLISSCNNFSTVHFTPGNELPYVSYLPTYAADAWYHGKLDAKYQEMSLESFLDEVRSFTSETYQPALFKGRSISEEERAAVASQMAAYTGLSEEFILASNLRVDLDSFCKELLHDEKLMVGRFDGRVTGPVTTGDLGDGASDPSSASGDIAFPVAVNQYINGELGFQTDRPYVVQSDEVNKKWKFGLDNESISQENIIYEAMSKNPFLKIWVLCGYYDAATPFYAAEWVYDHVFINDALQDNLSFTYYPSGHMVYVDADSLVQVHQDAEAWFGRG